MRACCCACVCPAAPIICLCPCVCMSSRRRSSLYGVHITVHVRRTACVCACGACDDPAQRAHRASPHHTCLGLVWSSVTNAQRSVGLRSAALRPLFPCLPHSSLHSPFHQSVGTCACRGAAANTCTPHRTAPHSTAHDGHHPSASLRQRNGTRANEHACARREVAQIHTRWRMLTSRNRWLRAVTRS